MAQISETWSAPLEFLATIYPVSRFSAAEVHFLARVACTAHSHKAGGISAQRLSLTLNFGVLDRLWQRDLPLSSRRNREAACVVLLVAVASCHAVRFNCVRTFAESVSGAGKPFESAQMPYAKAADLCTFANWLDVGVKYVQERDERSLRLLRDVCVRLVRGEAAEVDLGGATDAEFDVLMDYMLRPRPVLISPIRAQLRPQERRSKKDDEEHEDDDNQGDCNDSRATSPTTMPATPDSSVDDGHATDDSATQVQQHTHRDKKPRQHGSASSASHATETACQGVCAAPQPTKTKPTALSSERFHRSSDRSPKRPRVAAGFAEFVSARIVPPV